MSFFGKLLNGVFIGPFAPFLLFGGQIFKNNPLNIVSFIGATICVLGFMYLYFNVYSKTKNLIFTMIAYCVVHSIIFLVLYFTSSSSLAVLMVSDRGSLVFALFNIILNDILMCGLIFFADKNLFEDKDSDKYSINQKALLFFFIIIFIVIVSWAVSVIAPSKL